MAQTSTKFIMEYLYQTIFVSLLEYDIISPSEVVEDQDIRKGPLAQYTLFVVIPFAISYCLAQLDSIASVCIYFATVFYGSHVIWERRC